MNDLKCPRCGKSRVMVKTWDEVEVNSNSSSSSNLTYTQYDCPDADCQKRLNEELLKKHEDNLKREQIKNDHLANSRGYSEKKN